MDKQQFINMLDSQQTFFEVKETSIGTEIHMFFGDKTIIFEFDIDGKFNTVGSKDY